MILQVGPDEIWELGYRGWPFGNPRCLNSWLREPGSGTNMDSKAGFGFLGFRVQGAEHLYGMYEPIWRHPPLSSQEGSDPTELQQGALQDHMFKPERIRV